MTCSLSTIGDVVDRTIVPFDENSRILSSKVLLLLHRLLLPGLNWSCQITRQVYSKRYKENCIDKDEASQVIHQRPFLVMVAGSIAVAVFCQALITMAIPMVIVKSFVYGIIIYCD